MKSKGSEIFPLAILFLALTAVLYIFGIDRFGLFDVDEAIFAQASSEMITNNDWTNITYNGEDRYHKPHFIYWLQAVAMEKFGVDVFAARLPSAIAGFLTILMFFVSLERMTRNIRFSLIASAVLGLNLSFMVITQAATADMLMNFFSLAITMTVISSLYAKHINVMTLVICGFLVGAGIIAKGPVVGMVPAIVFATVAFFRMEELGYILRCVNPLVIIPAALVVLGPWVYALTDAGIATDFLNEFLGVHNINRFADGFGNTHSNSNLYYLWVLLVGFFPWSLLIPGAIFWLLPDFIHRLRSTKVEEALPAIGLIWFVVITVFFSFSQTKLAHYILPGYAGAALLLAGRLDALPRHKLVNVNMIWTWPIIVVFSLLFFIFKWVPDAIQNEGWLASLIGVLSKQFDFEWPVTDEQLLMVFSQDVSISIVPVMISAIVLIGCTSGWFLMNKGYRQGVVLTGAAMWMALFLIKVDVVPTVYAYQQQPLTNLAEKLKAGYEEGDQAYFLSFHQPSVRFISGVPFKPVDAPGVILADYKNAKNTWVATEYNNAIELENELKSGVTVEKDCEAGYCLVRITR